MKLTNMNLSEFNIALASKEPAPGGGSASAMAGAMGISLATMVANLTIGKKKYAEFDGLMEEIIAESATLQRKLTEAIDRDTEAYNGVSAVFSMPKETDEEKVTRANAMQDALKSASLVPLEVMELCDASLGLVEKMLGKSNTNCASDLGVAALNLGSAAMGAWMNVLINLGGIKDEEFASKVRTGGEEILKRCETASWRIIEQVMAGLS